MTYNVFAGTLCLTQSINHYQLCLPNVCWNLRKLN